MLLKDGGDSVRYELTDLLKLMEYLRTPQLGCPWDLKQTYRTIAPSTIEEAYEVVDAIESDNFSQLKEELGDLLFQAVFYCQLGKEDGLFDFDSVVDGLTKKLICRHPHVFPDGKLELRASGSLHDDDTGVKRNWEQLKRAEREKKGQVGLLDDVPLGMPALSRAIKLQKRAAQVGFDWRNAADVVEKLEEELTELKGAIASGCEKDIAEEFGDLAFTVANLSRHLKLDGEAVLRSANAKFARRFNAVEKMALDSGQDIFTCSLDVLDAYWEKVKAGERE